MVRIQTDRPYTSVRREIRAQWRAPLGSSADRQPSNAGALQKAPVAVHHRSACSGLKALRNTSAARRLAAKLCYRFGPLIPSARSANLIAGDGTKNGFPAPNKELATNQKRPLDRKSPIQVRIQLPPAESHTKPGSRIAERSSAGCRRPYRKRNPAFSTVLISPHDGTSFISGFCPVRRCRVWISSSCR